MRSTVLSNGSKMARWAVSAGLAIVITVLSFAFHRPPRVVDALTGAPVEGIEILISTWRTLFEPFLGPLLFYLRADQPLIEISVLLLWLVLLLLPVVVLRTPGRGTARLSRGTLFWLAILPILLITWSAVVLVIVFAPLPSNTVRNLDPDRILVNIHSHTHYSHDGIIPPEELARWHRRNGFDAFFITEHNHHGKTLEWVRAQEQGRWVDHPLLLAGQEYSGSNHILLLGLVRDFATKDMADETAMDSAHAQGGAVIVAHWFADHRRPVLDYIQMGADGFEIANQAEGLQVDPRYLDEILRGCEAHGLLTLVSCDYHGYGSAAYAWNAIRLPGWRDLPPRSKRRAIVRILRERRGEAVRPFLYSDREFLPRALVSLTPLHNAVSYFRSLSAKQTLSWVVWIGIFTLLFRIAGSRARSRGFRLWAYLGMISACFTALVGLRLLARAGGLSGYNEIYMEYGQYFLIFGLLFFAYSVILRYGGGLKRLRLSRTKH